MSPRAQRILALASVTTGLLVLLLLSASWALSSGWSADRVVAAVGAAVAIIAGSVASRFEATARWRSTYVRRGAGARGNLRKHELVFASRDVLTLLEQILEASSSNSEKQNIAAGLIDELLELRKALLIVHAAKEADELDAQLRSLLREEPNLSALMAKRSHTGSWSTE